MKKISLLLLFCYSTVVSYAGIGPGFIGYDATICSGTTVQINELIAASEVATAATYIWQISADGLTTWTDISGATGLNYISSTPATENSYYRRVVRDDLNNIAISNIVAIKVTTSVPTAVSILGNYTVDRCNLLYVIAEPTNGGTNPIYLWKKNGIVINNIPDIASLITNDIADGDIITCDMTTNVECPISATVISNSLVAHVPSKIVVFISANTSGNLIAGQSVNLKAVPSEDIYQTLWYTWYKNGQVVGDQTELLNTTYTSGDIYSVRMHVEDCVPSLYFDSAPFISSDFSTSITGPIAVSPNQKNVSYSVLNRTGMSYFWTVPVEATIASGQGTNSIVVDFGVNTSAAIQRVTGTGGSFITVKETNAASVSSTLTLELSNVTNTKESQLAASVLVYPIPADNEFYVEFTGSFPVSPVNYALYDAKGILITQGPLNSNATPIHLETVPSGIYLLLIETDGSIGSKKIVKK